MLTILTTTDHETKVVKTIESVSRLEELVSVIDSAEKVIMGNKLLTLSNGFISKPLDWNDESPPYLIPETEFTTDNLLAFIFYELGNYQKAFEYLALDSPLYKHLWLVNCLRFGCQISEELLPFVAQQNLHNQCIINQYGNYKKNISSKTLKSNFQKTIQDTTELELKVFSSKYYINFLISTKAYDEATEVVNSFDNKTLSVEAQNALNIQKANILSQQLSYPFDKNKLIQIQFLLQQGIDFYEQKALKVNAVLLLMEAAQIASYQEDYLESKDLINKAIRYLKTEGLTELLGEAIIQKAALLYAWSKKDQPQYYKSAINTYQDALKVFKRDTHPQQFAEIHHNMALIYSEIPVSNEEKPMWIAFCASSFKEALAFYKRDEYPYEYAMVSHNYATALMNFPEAKLKNHLYKAQALFEEALTIRAAKYYPIERASTLINQLELYWLLDNETLEDESQKIAEMQSKIDEAKTLTNEPSILERIDYHNQQLKALKTVL